jgi:tripartite-type tricarboxylate transporter receptor subunit TctC
MKCNVECLAAALFFWTSSGVQAAEYPMRAIRYIVPQAAGGSSDTVARLVTQKLSESIGHQGLSIIVPARPETLVPR